MELPNDYICEGQLSIWDCMMGATPFKFDPHKVLRVIELFAGYGSQNMALKRLGIPFEHHKVVEFDKYAIRSFNAVHGTDFPVIDIRDVKGKDLEIVDKDKYQYLMTYSFPCTDLSVAGAMKGMEEGSGTRSSLLWEVKRLLEESEELPDVLMMENVPQVHGENNIKAFDRWLLFLERKGYRTIYKDMNAKHYGVAQSRSRCFAISILGNHTYKFPNPFPLKKTMRDYLEDDVDERYYLTNEKAKNLIDKLVADGKIPTDRQTDRQTIDLCLKKPRTIDSANCIKARYDVGISNQQADGTGVAEWTSICI